jgi:hypothetical protein
MNDAIAIEVCSEEVIFGRRESLQAINATRPEESGDYGCLLRCGGQSG